MVQLDVGVVSIPVAFGRALRRFRLERGLSQDKLAILAGLDRTYVSLLERGLRQPSLTTLLGLADCLEVAGSKLVDATVSEFESM